MMAMRGPSTPYDLKRAVNHSVGYFWPFPHAQLYLSRSGSPSSDCWTLDVEETGSSGKTYSITHEGLAALSAWPAEPTMSSSRCATSPS